MSFVNTISLYSPKFTSLGTISATSNSITVDSIALEHNALVFAIVEMLEISIKGRV